MFQRRSVRWSMAAAAIVIAFVGIGSWPKLSNSKSSGVAFADVLEIVQSAHSVQFKAVTTVQLPGLGAHTMTTDTIVVEEPNRMRQTFAPDSEIMPSGMVKIWDFREGRCLTLYPQVKRAVVEQMTNVPSEQKAANLLEMFRQLHDKHDKVGIPIGEKEIAGRLTQGFKVGEPPTDMEMLIWVDTETRLPVLIEMTMESETIPLTTATWTDFVWDPEVDESLMSLTPPAGYEVSLTPAKSRTVTVNLDTATATEQDVIEGLKIMAQLNDGKFPATLDVDVQSQPGIFKAMLKASMLNDPAQRKEAEAKLIQLMSPIGLAWKFINDPKNGDDFHYAGKDVTAGQAGTPVLWYQPKDSATYRVIDADLTVRDVLSADLPSVTSTLLRPKTAAAAAQPPQQ